MKPYIISAAICMGLLASCADNDMTQLSTSEPSSISAYDYLSSYDVLKSYTDFTVGVNMDATTFLADGVPYRIAVSNFSGLVPGLTFSHGSTMKANGAVDTTKIVKVINQAKAMSMSVFGYPLISNTNQNSTYLSSKLEPNVIRPAGDTGGYGLKMTNTVKMSSATAAQVAYTFARTPSVEPGIKYKLTFMVRGTATGKVQCATYSNSRGSRFTPEFTVTTKWTKVSMTNSMASGITGLQSILFNIGQYVGTMYVDNIELYELDDWDGEASDNLNTLNGNLDDAETTAKSIAIQTNNDGLEDVGVSALGEGYDPLATYVDKTTAEKDSILLSEMNTYLGGVIGKAKSSVTEWGVVCNPLDSTAIATSTGKTLSSGDFYWADCMGKDFAVSAFKVAAQKGNANDKLYICESGMENSTAKCTALLAYVKYIESQGARVDGIGTTINVSTSIADRDQISTLLENLASSGKMVKITDLKVAIGNGVLTDSASEEQLKAQSDLYEYIVKTYKEKVPAAQRGGIIQSTLLDTNSSPLGLWSRTYSRKHAYGGFAKGLKE
jgi:endo-1,4-beta-xylanase